jgi:hypothetical protein
MTKPTRQYQVALLIGALLLAFARLALDVLAEVTERPPAVQNIMDIVLISLLVLALYRQERSAGETPIAYSRSTLIAIVLFGVALGLSVSVFAFVLLRH